MSQEILKCPCPPETRKALNNCLLCPRYAAMVQSEAQGGSLLDSLADVPHQDKTQDKGKPSPQS